jgi:hypothetical protein
MCGGERDDEHDYCNAVNLVLFGFLWETKRGKLLEFLCVSRDMKLLIAK